MAEAPVCSFPKSIFLPYLVGQPPFFDGLMAVQNKDNIPQPPLQIGGTTWLRPDPLNVSRNVVWDFQGGC